MQRGGSVIDAPTTFYMVVFIAVLNVIAFATVEDWKSIFFLFLAAGAAFAVMHDPTFALVVGIVASNLYRATATLQEGLENADPKDSAKPTPEKRKPMPTKPVETIEIPKPSNTADADNLLDTLKSGNIETLMGQQKRLMESITNMGPLMQSAKEALSLIPKDFLQKAIKNVQLN